MTGEIALIENGKRTASVRAAEPTELCFLTKHDFQELLDNNPGVREKILKVVAERKERDAKRKAEEEAKAKLEAEMAAAAKLSKDLSSNKSTASRSGSVLSTPSRFGTGVRSVVGKLKANRYIPPVE